VIGNTEKQLVDCIQQIKTLGEENKDLKMAAEQLIEVVDPQENDAADGRSLLE
jgi:regulator of replication initiation timing